MKAFYAILDKALTAVLMVLLIAMVFSISSEILINAVIQPLTGVAIRNLTPEKTEPSIAQESEQKKTEPRSGLLRFLEAAAGRAARLSAPVNTISETLLVWVGILGSALAFRFRAHLGVDALVRLYPPRIKLLLDYLSTLCVAIFSVAVLVVGGGWASADAFRKGSRMPGLEMFNRGWFFLVLPVAGILLLMYCFYHFLHPKPAGGAAAEPD